MVKTDQHRSFPPSVTHFVCNQGNRLQLRTSQVVSFTYCNITVEETGYGEIGFILSVGFETFLAFLNRVSG